MKLPDVKLLLHAVDESSARHEPARAWAALDLMDGWLAQPCVTVVHPTSRHAPVLR